MIFHGADGPEKGVHDQTCVLQQGRQTWSMQASFHLVHEVAQVFADDLARGPLDVGPETDA